MDVAIGMVAWGIAAYYIAEMYRPPRVRMKIDGLGEFVGDDVDTIIAAIDRARKLNVGKVVE